MATKIEGACQKTLGRVEFHEAYTQEEVKAMVEDIKVIAAENARKCYTNRIEQMTPPRRWLSTSTATCGRGMGSSSDVVRGTKLFAYAVMLLAVSVACLGAGVLMAYRVWEVKGDGSWMDALECAMEE